MADETNFERGLHKAAGLVAETLWGAADATRAVCDRVERVADGLNQLGHDAIDVAIAYSEQKRRDEDAARVRADIEAIEEAFRVQFGYRAVIPLQPYRLEPFQLHFLKNFAGKQDVSKEPGSGG